MVSHERYYVPEQSPWPVIASLGLLCGFAGAGLWLNALKAGREGFGGPLLLLCGALLLAATFAKHGVSLQAVRQESTGAQARLGVMSHLALGEQTDAAIAELGGMPEVHPGIAVMRVQGA